MKTLILVGNKSLYFFPYAKGETFDLEQALVDPGQIRYRRKGLRKRGAFERFRMVGELGSWTEKLSDYSKVIVFDNAISWQVEKVLLRHMKHGGFPEGVHVFYWNIMGHTPQEAAYMRSCISSKFFVYSYSHQDAQVEGIRYSSTVACKISPQPAQQLQARYPVKYDAMFAGSLKAQRLDILDTTIGQLKELGLKLWLDVGRSPRPQFKDAAAKNFEIQDTPKTYLDNIEAVLSSKAILDVDANGFPAVNTRAVEAIMYHKKFITTNPAYKQEPFYDPNNIFVLGVDKVGQLPAFLETPYREPEENWETYFSFEEWTRRFTK